MSKIAKPRDLDGYRSRPKRSYLLTSMDVLYTESMRQTCHPKLLPLLDSSSVLRTSDLAALGLPRTVLAVPLAQGAISRIGRGIYSVTGHEVTEHHSLAQAAAHVPQGVICLLSALVVHGMTTQSPHEVWMALDGNTRRPVVGSPTLRIVRFGGPALTEGVESRMIDGISVRLTTAAKTVADCFKFRNKVGIAVAVEALRDGLAKRLFTLQELDLMAHVCRVHNVLKPYLEALI